MGLHQIKGFLHSQGNQQQNRNNLMSENINQWYISEGVNTQNINSYNLTQKKTNLI